MEVDKREFLAKRWQLFAESGMKKRVLITFMLAGLYIALSNIPLPGIRISPQTVQESIPAGNGIYTAIEFLSLFSPSSFLSLSVLSLGILPYITSQKLLELLVMVSPSLQRSILDSFDGGRSLKEKWTRYLVIPVSAAAAMFIFLLSPTCQGSFLLLDALHLKLFSLTTLTVVSVLVAGSFFSLWIGELISAYGIKHNGLGILMLSGIVAKIPADIAGFKNTTNPAGTIIAYAIIWIVCVAVVVTLINARRSVPVIYPMRRMGNQKSAPSKTVLNIPIIFGSITEGFIGGQLLLALTTFYLPLLIMCTSVDWLKNIGTGLVGIFDKNSLAFGPVVFILVYVFTIFYSNMNLSGQNLGDALKGARATIPGVHLGIATDMYLRKISNRILPIGAATLGLLAIIPWGFNLLLGTHLSLLASEKLIIVVLVILDLVQSVDSGIRFHDRGVL